MRNSMRGVIITVAVFAGIIGALLLGLNSVNSRSDAEQAETLRQAVRRATTLCYAVEGRYPANAHELREHYGLSYDEDRFIVVLDSFASNLYPDVRVLSVGGESYE